MNKLGSISIRSKLVLLIGALLAAIAIFLLQFFPPRMEAISRDWTERRARDVTTVIGERIRSEVELGADKQADETLASLKTAGDTVYAVALKADRSVSAGWNQDKAPVIDAIPDQPRLSSRGDVLDVVIPLKAQLGPPGVLV